MNFASVVKKFWPEVVIIATGLWTGFGTQIQAYISAHPALTGVLGTIALVVAHLAPSPVAAQVTNVPTTPSTK
jgi:hypothetical protein